MMNFAVIILTFTFTTVNSWSTKDSHISNRIVNGRPAKYGEFPFAVLITYYWYYIPDGDSSFCGGTIIHESWVLTAGHCVQSNKGPNSENTRILCQAGTIYRRGDEQRQEVRMSEKIHVWSEFNRTRSWNEKDIALIKLSEPFHLDGFYKRAAQLPKLNAKYSGRVKVAGWGHTTYNYRPQMIYDPVPNELLVGDYNLLSFEQCQKALDNLSAMYKIRIAKLPSMNICTGPLNVMQGICQGDSGGGLISYNSKNNPVIVGVVQRHFVGCAAEGSPSIYVDVAYFVRWINSITGIPYRWGSKKCKNARCDPVEE